MLRRAAIAHLAAAFAPAAIVAAPAQAIVGGTSAKPSAYPWHAELPFCGGALIAPDRVATAAHCVAGLPLRDFGTVRFGNGAVRQVAGTSVHPDYLRRALAGTANREGPADDVAIVLLAAPLTGVKPLALRAKAPKAGTRVLLLGGGRKAVPPKPGSTDPRGESQRVQAAANFEPLRKATLAMISDAACRAFYRRQGAAYRSTFRPSGMLCATDPDGRRPFRSACGGDSGGPLVAGSTLAGIVSWGLRCGGDLDPTVFSDPSAYRSFLTAAAPVLGPLGSGMPALLTGDARVGATLTCTSPPWLRQPDRITFTFDSYRFGDGRLTRQRGVSPTYVVRAEDAGRLVGCVVTGANGGGYESAPPAAALRIPA